MINVDSNKLLEQAKAYHLSGDLESAKVKYQQLLSIEPNDSIVLHLLGVLYLQQNNQNTGFDLLSSSVALNARCDNQTDLATCYYQQNNLSYAKLYYQKALNLNANFIKALTGLAVVYFSDKNYSTAIKYLFKAESINSNDLDIIANLVKVYKASGDIIQAKKYCKRALEIESKNIDMLVSLSEIYYFSGDYHLALNTIEYALQLFPNDTEANLIKGHILKEKKQYSLAINYYKKSIRENELSIFRLAQLAECYLEICNWSKLKELTITIKQLIADNTYTETLTPLQGQMLGLKSDDFKKMCQGWISHYQISSDLIYPATKYSEHEKFYIGYITFDFQDHPVFLWVRTLFEYHNREEFKIFLFATAKITNKDRAYLLPLFDEIIELPVEDAVQSAKIINSNEIDILIDLTGPMQKNNFDILKYKPAAIQCHTAGIVGTTGFSAIDYIFSTTNIIDESILDYITETVVYLPDISFAAVPLKVNKATFLHSNYNLPEDKFIFSCLSRTSRITEELFICYMQILQQSPNSILWLQKADDEVCNNLVNYAKKYNIDQERLVFCPPTILTSDWHHSLADLWLDTFTLSSGTGFMLCTAASIPVLTKYGDTPASRLSASLNLACGFNGLVAYTKDEYIEKAVNFAKHPELIIDYKNKISASLDTIPLFNPSKFTKNLEQAYKYIYQHFWSKSSSRDITI